MSGFAADGAHDGLTRYQKVSACNAMMVFSDLVAALKHGEVFKAHFDGVDLSRCRVYFIGHELPGAQHRRNLAFRGGDSLLPPPVRSLRLCSRLVM